MPESPEQTTLKGSPEVSSEGSKERVVEELLKEAKAAVLRLCEGCRNEVAFNMAGEHGFDIHSRPCQAAGLQAAIEKIEKGI